MKRIIFVGLHNKPNMNPLDSRTKTGKIIDKIINELPKKLNIEKSNLFNIDRMPLMNEIYDLRQQWHWTYLPVDDDIIILLGSFVHKFFIKTDKVDFEIIKVAHPASKRSNIDIEKYIKDVVKKIKQKLQQ